MGKKKRVVRADTVLKGLLGPRWYRPKAAKDVTVVVEMIGYSAKIPVIKGGGGVHVQKVGADYQIHNDRTGDLKYIRLSMGELEALSMIYAEISKDAS